MNRILSGSWQAHCAKAGLKCNERPAWGPQIWERALSAQLLDVFKKAFAAAVVKTE